MLLYLQNVTSLPVTLLSVRPTQRHVGGNLNSGITSTCTSFKSVCSVAGINCTVQLDFKHDIIAMLEEYAAA